MPIYKRILLAMLLPVLPLLLFGIAFSFGLNQAVGSAENVKEVLNKSGVYETLIPNFLNNAQKESGGEINIALSDPKVKEAAEKAFTPDFVKQSSEEIIDGTFAWLNGETAAPTFNIDLSQVKITFAAHAAAAAEKQAATLPRCTAGNTPAEFDAFTATCLPAGVTPASAAARTQAQILSGQGFLENSAIDAGSLKAEGTNQSVFEQMGNVPVAYQQAKKLPIYLTVLAILVITGIIFLSATRLKGIRHIGITFLVIGALMLVLSWVVGGEFVERIRFEDNVLAADLKNLLRDLADAAATNYRLFGGIYIALGTAAVAGVIFMNRRNSQPEPVADKIDATSSEAPTEPAKKRTKK